MNKFITTREFISMLLEDYCGGNRVFDCFDYAYKIGLITHLDVYNAEEPIMRKSAARIVHGILQTIYNEEDEPDWFAAESLADLYSCHICVMHIAQCYVKGIISERRPGLFGADDFLTDEEALTLTKKIFDLSKRTPPNVIIGRQ